MNTTYSSVSETTTVIFCQHSRNLFEVFTQYSDAESTFYSYQRKFTNFQEAKAYELKLIAKFAQ